MQRICSQKQLKDKPIREYVTSPKTCAVDCNFLCPGDEQHDLRDYHINRPIYNLSSVPQNAQSLSGDTTVSSKINPCFGSKKQRRSNRKVKNNKTMSTSVMGLEPTTT